MPQPIDPYQVDFRALHVLVRVHDLRSFTKAAQELGINQSAVSYTVEKLRELFQDPLFVRHARQIEPTPRCNEVVTQLRGLLQEYRQLTIPPKFDPLTMRQKFIIACNYFERVLIIPQIVKSLRHKAPGIELEIIDASDNGEERLLRSEADFLIGPLEGKDSALYRRKLFDDRYACLFDPSHPAARAPLSLDTYLNLNHVLVTYGGKWRSRYLIDLEKRGYDLPIALRVPSPAGLEQLVAGSDLVATVPSRLAQVKSSQVVALEYPLDISIDIALVWSSLTHNAASHIWMRELIYGIAGQSRFQTG
ncbi:MAG: LysR family transcriptional regulator [Mangrovicoccus sp.]